MPGIFVNRNPRHLAGNSSFLSGPSLAFFSGVCYSFGLGQTITRAQFVTVTARMLGWDTKTTTAPGFTDTKGHWAEGAIPSGYADAVKQLQANGCHLNLSVFMDNHGGALAAMLADTYRNPYLTYQTEDGKHWFVWYEDSRSVGEKVRLAKLFGVTSVSLWRLGNLPADSTDGLYYNVLSACQ